MIMKHNAKHPCWCNWELWLEIKTNSFNWSNDSFISLNFRSNRAVSKSWRTNRPFISMWRTYEEKDFNN